MRALRIAATGMAAQQLNVETISNNIANMNTIGFKRQRAEFQDLLYENLSRPGAQTSDAGTVAPTGVQLGSGVKTGTITRITQQGTLTKTDNKFDVAINGKGYFQIQLPSGAGQTTQAKVGQLQLATFYNEAGLDAIGDNYFLQSGSSGAPNVGNPQAVGFGGLQQGYTEASNVDAVTEITSLIVAQRAYEMNSKVVNAADQMLSTTSQLKS